MTDNTTIKKPRRGRSPLAEHEKALAKVKKMYITLTQLERIEAENPNFFEEGKLKINSFENKDGTKVGRSKSIEDRVADAEKDYNVAVSNYKESCESDSVKAIDLKEYLPQAKDVPALEQKRHIILELRKYIRRRKQDITIQETPELLEKFNKKIAAAKQKARKKNKNPPKRTKGIDTNQGRTPLETKVTIKNLTTQCKKAEIQLKEEEDKLRKSDFIQYLKLDLIELQNDKRAANRAKQGEWELDDKYKERMRKRKKAVSDFESDIINKRAEIKDAEEALKAKESAQAAPEGEPTSEFSSVELEALDNDIESAKKARDSLLKKVKIARHQAEKETELQKIRDEQVALKKELAELEAVNKKDNAITNQEINEESAL